MKTELTIDRATFTATYKGKSCFLGNKKVFYLLERLAVSPGIFIPFETLADEVWGDEMTDAKAIQQQASRLRILLHKARLAIEIDGKTRGHYRLILR